MRKNAKINELNLKFLYLAYYLPNLTNLTSLFKTFMEAEDRKRNTNKRKSATALKDFKDVKLI